MTKGFSFSLRSVASLCTITPEFDSKKAPCHGPVGKADFTLSLFFLDLVSWAFGMVAQVRKTGTGSNAQCAQQKPFGGLEEKEYKHGFY